MSEIKCTHSCSDCSRLGCRSASEDQYPPFCLTTNVDRDLLDETLEIYRNDELQGRIARTSACIEGEFYGEIGVPNEKKLNGGCGHESMCNPIMQAKTLAANGCDFNIVIGLCVGHDTLFLRHSKVPTTVMIVKDRVLQHNPAAALYGAQSMYSRFKNLNL